MRKSIEFEHFHFKKNYSKLSIERFYVSLGENKASASIYVEKFPANRTEFVYIVGKVITFNQIGVIREIQTKI